MQLPKRKEKILKLGAQISHQTLYTLKLIFENAIFPELCVMFPTGMLRGIFFYFILQEFAMHFRLVHFKQNKTGSQTKKEVCSAI
jgi:hypothetical protein